MRIASWNVNGIRSAEKEVISFLESYQPEIVFLQELRAHPNDLSFFLKMVPGYQVEFNPAQRSGYSGTAVYYRDSIDCQPENEIGNEVLNQEGRTMAVKLDNMILLNLYVPNGNISSERLQFKLSYLKNLIKFIEKLINQRKSVIIGADMNIAHTKKDLYRPKTAKNSSGFLPVERELFHQLLDIGLVDTFRLFEKEGGHYTWWAFNDKERIENHGWRFDYFLVSKDLVPNVKESKILKDIFGSDHCPIFIHLEGVLG